MRSFSNLEAFRYYEEAAAILDKLPKTDAIKKKLLDVIVKITIPMRLINFPDPSLKLLQEGVELTKEFGDKKSLGSLYGALGLYHSYYGEMSKALEYIEYCFKQGQDIQDVELMGPAAIVICQTSGISGHFSKTLDTAPEVIDLLEKTKREQESFGTPLNVYGELLCWEGLALTKLGRIEEGFAITEKSLNYAIKNNYVTTRCFSEWIYGFILIQAGLIDMSIEQLQNSIKYHEETA